VSASKTKGDLPPPQGGPVPEPLVQRDTERDMAYEAMLLWAMANPEERSNRMIAQSLTTNESNVRLWKRKYGWAIRCAQVHNCEYVALDLYRRRMEEHVGTDRADGMRAGLDMLLSTAGFASLRAAVRRQRVGLSSQLDKTAEAKEEPKKAPETAKTPNGYASQLAPNELEGMDSGRHMRDLGYQIKRDHLRPADIRRQVLLIDAVLGLVAKRVQTGELKVSVRDIPQLLKARALLTGLPTEHVAVQQQVQHEHHHVVESVRMQQARKSGDETTLVAAMRDEVDELQAILQAVPKPVVVVDITPEEPNQ
jgi:hypothetical protein